MGTLSTCISLKNVYAVPTETRRGHWFPWNCYYCQLAANSYMGSGN